MMKRLKCGDRLLRIKRSQPDFTEWSQQRDPNNIAWQYKDGEFFPLEVTKPEPESSKKEPEPKPSSSKTKTKTKSKAKQSQKTTQKSKKEPVQAVKTEVQPLSGRQMMKRLKCGDRLLRIKRSQPDFKEWSQERDPDGVAWKYTKGQFVPLKVSKLDTASVKEESQPKLCQKRDPEGIAWKYQDGEFVPQIG